jgi:hypothetical protein
MLQYKSYREINKKVFANPVAAAAAAVQWFKQMFDLSLRAMEPVIRRETGYIMKATECCLSGNARESNAFKIAMDNVLIQNDWLTSLRLLCLLCACGNPLSSAELSSVQNEIRAEFAEVKDTEIEAALADLERLRLLSTTKMVPSIELFPVEDRRVPMDEGLRDQPVRPSTVLTQKIVLNDRQWINKFNGRAGEFRINERGELGSDDMKPMRRALVFFVGGVTVTELNYLRAMQRKNEFEKWELVVASTDVIPPGQFLKQFSAKLGMGLEHVNSQ